MTTSSNSFDAANAVPDLDYDFAPFAPDAKGVIPEPSQTAFEKFQKAFNAVVPDGDVTKLNELSKEESDRRTDLYLTAIAKLCSNTPTKAQIKKLPYRHQVAFIGWIFNTFRPATILDPQRDTPETEG